MPDGLLLLAFALTLMANAVLIAVAIRAMRPGGQFADESAPGRRQVARPDPARMTADAEPSPKPPDEASAESKPPLVEPAKPRRRTATPTDSTSPPRRNPKANTSPGAEATTVRGSGRRRRFSLPPLDDDRDKVNRSIESFLSGGDSGGESAGEPGTDSGSDPAADPASSSTAHDIDTPPTTVALVEVTGAGWVESPPDGPDGSAVGPGVAAVERALRGAARATDRVEGLGSGRFRVVLAATGELAARTYLRRVRATTEPLLDDLDPPRRLAVATATVLDEPVIRAGEIAERRLAAFLEASRMHDRDVGIEPRAAGH